MARKDPIAHLSRHPTELPARLVSEVLALGEPGLRQLVAIIEDPRRWVEDPVGVANATLVLGRSGDPIAVPGLLRLHAEADLDGLVYAKAGSALFRCADPTLVEPLLALPLTGARRADATDLLAWCGKVDPRISERIAELVREDPERGAKAAGVYGDPGLVPMLRAAFDARLAEGTSEEADVALEILAALGALGASDEARERSLRDLYLRANAALLEKVAKVEADLERVARLARAAELPPRDEA